MYWIDGSWLGKLVLVPRPRGGDRFGEEVSNWQQAGVDTVLSLLTPEEQDFDLINEVLEIKARGMKFLSFPVQDRQAPASETAMANVLEKVEMEFTAGRNVVVHCSQGVGRAGLVAACLLVTKGWDPQTAVQYLTAKRGAPVPETPEQSRWLEHYAMSVSSR